MNSAIALAMFDMECQDMRKEYEQREYQIRNEYEPSKSYTNKNYNNYPCQLNRGPSDETIKVLNIIRPCLSEIPITCSEIREAAGTNYSTLIIANAIKYDSNIGHTKVIRQTKYGERIYAAFFDKTKLSAEEIDKLEKEAKAAEARIKAEAQAKAAEAKAAEARIKAEAQAKAAEAKAKQTKKRKIITTICFTLATIGLIIESIIYYINY